MERNTRVEIPSPKSEVRSRPRRALSFQRWTRLVPALLCFGLAASARAALQFDVFVGYGGQPNGTDGIVREAGWFPVSVEVQNDGPPFNAVFELSLVNQMGSGQTRRMLVELPTNTRKRFAVPAFSGAASYSTWEARLLDERGKVRGTERTGLRPRFLAGDSILLGATPRTFGGLPKLPELKNNNNRSPMQPLVARLPVEQYPDTPIALESLDAVYLNSEKALELKINQAAALLAWLHEGGHLIIGVEQPSDINATPWLRPLLPFELTAVGSVKASREIIEWLSAGAAQEEEPFRSGQRNNSRIRVVTATRSAGPVAYPAGWLAPDSEFEQVEFPVATGTLRDGRPVLSLAGTPLIVSARRGRGQITVLLFSPEREPFRSWKNREWLWAKLAAVPPAWYGPDYLNPYGGWSVDGVFGAMIDSRQVRKLPVQWLLLLLVVYLLVIGPVDQYCLKRANKQMLTWLTFPLYVALFSLLIYYIGYKLRAGETEWNELHLVDILPHGETAEWRGRTYASVYSPVSAWYKVAGEQPQASLRGEFMGAVSGGQEASQSRVLQRDKGFEAEIQVPVWTSQLFVSDWLQSGAYPFRATVAPKGTPQGATWEVALENHLDRELKEVRLVVRDRVYNLGTVPPNKISRFSVDQRGGLALRDFLQQNGNQFTTAAQNRQHAFGDNTSRWLDLNAAHLTAISFGSQMMSVPPNQRLICPPGMDLSPVVERGDAVLLAWDTGHAPGNGSMNRFKTVRSRRDTLLRLAVPAGPTQP